MLFLPYLFFFYSSSPRRSLPSFPTRRSSDLVDLRKTRTWALSQHSSAHRQRWGDQRHLPQDAYPRRSRSEEHTSELQSRFDLVCRLLLEKKKKKIAQCVIKSAYDYNNLT